MHGQEHNQTGDVEERLNCGHSQKWRVDSGTTSYCDLCDEIGKERDRCLTLVEMAEWGCYDDVAVKVADAIRRGECNG